MCVLLCWFELHSYCTFGTYVRCSWFHSSIHLHGCLVGCGYFTQLIRLDDDSFFPWDFLYFPYPFLIYLNFYFFNFLLSFVSFIIICCISIHAVSCQVTYHLAYITSYYFSDVSFYALYTNVSIYSIIMTSSPCIVVKTNKCSLFFSIVLSVWILSTL